MTNTETFEAIIDEAQNEDNDLAKHVIKTEPEEEMDTGNYSDGNYYGGGDEPEDDDNLLSNFSLQMKVDSFHDDSPRRALRASRIKNNLTIVDDKDKSEDVDDEVYNDKNDDWKQNSESEEDDDWEEKAFISKRNRKALRIPSSERRQGKPPNTTSGRLANSKSKKLWIWCPNCRARCENLVIYEAHVLRVHKGENNKLT